MLTWAFFNLRLESYIEAKENGVSNYVCPQPLMPKLSEIGNSDAVDSVYAARAVVYVEADADSDVFARIVGMNNAQRVAFKAPRADGGGYKAVCTQVDQERLNGNHRVFGLIDGESAATLGSLCQLIAATSAIFPLTNYDGVFCLAEHELENLMLLHGDICCFLVNDVELANLSTRDRAEIEKTLKDLTRRFLAAAILKYAALQLRHRGKQYNLVNVGRFQERTTSTKSIRTAIQQEIVNSGLDWDTFRDQVIAIRRALRQRFRDEGLSKEERSFHMLRLSDGKGLMKSLRSVYNASKKMDGHLVNTLVGSNYAGVFRGEILTAVAGASALNGT
ncbi:MAG: hypothetical protein OXH63_22275 [Gemmatimonadetes bacterium]|nr:hypothetical protein [Gemmatimonadota bacterium]